ncbi:MAG: NUDIX domain-containing protein [Syntrophales bacterium]|nr:NUDIX domain-containing protein [Syntrophales bacterium]
MAKSSAGILLFRETKDQLEVLLAHPGGPLWTRKDDGWWSIPKGEIGENEDPLAAARREFTEETGATLTPTNDAIDLGTLRQRSGKIVHIWAMRGDFDPASLRSNTFSIEWPPNSGRVQEFPEVDRAGWFTIAAAGQKIINGQAEFLTRLQNRLDERRS